MLSGVGPREHNMRGHVSSPALVVTDRKCRPRADILRESRDLSVRLGTRRRTRSGIRTRRTSCTKSWTRWGRAISRGSTRVAWRARKNWTRCWAASSSSWDRRRRRTPPGSSWRAWTWSSAEDTGTAPGRIGCATSGARLIWGRQAFLGWGSRTVRLCRTSCPWSR